MRAFILNSRGSWLHVTTDRPEGCLQHVGNDPDTPHVGGEGDKVIVHNFGGEEFGRPEVDLQLLSGFVPEI